MNAPFFIDPIKVEEARTRLQTRQTTMRNGAAAADALIWFAEYAMKNKPLEVLSLKVSVVASLTPGANEANGFLQKAVEHFAGDILNKAVELAALRFENAQRIADEGL